MIMAEVQRHKRKIVQGDQRLKKELGIKNWIEPNEINHEIPVSAKWFLKVQQIKIGILHRFNS
jgi:hypothetical protein